MKKYVIYLFLLVLSVGCTANNPNQTTEELHGEDEGMFGAKIGDQHTTEKLLVDSREEVDMDGDNKLSVTEAESIVNSHLQIDKQSDVYVVFDSILENGLYLIHVDHLTEEKSASHNNQEGWYTVNPTTREVKKHNPKKQSI